MKHIAVLLLFTAVALAQPKLIVLDKSENALVVLDPESGKVLSRATTGDAPHEVAVSADGKMAYVGNYGARDPGHSLTIVDLATMKSRQVDLGALRRPHGIVVSGGEVYFTAEMNKAIARYDPASDKVDWLMGTGQSATHMIVVSRDGSRMFTANIGSDSVTIFERAANSQNPLAWNETVVQVGKGPEGIDLSPDGRELWAANSRDGTLSIIDAAQKKVVQTVDLKTRRSNRLKFTPDGKTVLISDLDAGELVVIDAAARKEIKRIAVGKSAEGILVAPDGARAYVACEAADEIVVVDLKAFTVVKRLQPGKGPDGMAWLQ